MRLDVIEGAGGVIIFTVTATGHAPESLVMDPRNVSCPVLPYSQWVADMGGVRLFPKPKDGRGIAR